MIDQDSRPFCWVLIPLCHHGNELFAVETVYTGINFVEERDVLAALALHHRRHSDRFQFQPRNNSVCGDIILPAAPVCSLPDFSGRYASGAAYWALDAGECSRH